MISTTHPAGAETNWAGNVTYGARRLHHPTTVEQLQEIVASSRRVRALGTRHSFNGIADTDADLVSVSALPPDVVVDADRAVVHVPAGIRYGELARRLDADGLALANLGSLPHIGVAGACATGTHGSGDRNGSLATAVAGLQIVGADGRIASVDTADDRLPGLVVGLGALGVVTRVSLRVEPAYDVRQVVYRDLPLATVERDLDAVFGAAYSVSLFTRWRSDVFELVWLKQRVGTGPADAPEPEWLGARLADGPCHPIPGMPAQNCTVQGAVPGPWYERLPHFRLEFTPSSGEELQSEYLVPRSSAVDALRQVDAVRDRVAAVLQVCEVRTVTADELWMSPAYGRDSVAVHFTWVPDAAAVAPVVAELERRLEPFRARPHWGKVFSTSPQTLAAVYPRHRDFSRLLRDQDPEGTFRNAFVDRYFPDA